jgi:hypothetical protein
VAGLEIQQTLIFHALLLTQYIRGKNNKYLGEEA